MQVAHSTARTHVQNVLTKLGVRSRLQAAALVAREGLAGELDNLIPQPRRPAAGDLPGGARPRSASSPRDLAEDRLWLEAAGWVGRPLTE